MAIEVTCKTCIMIKLLCSLQTTSRPWNHYQSLNIITSIYSGYLMWIVAFNICPLSWVRNMCNNQYLETMLLSLVTKDAFVVVEALVKNQCEGKTLQLFPSTFHNQFFFNFLIFFFPCSCKFMICVCFSKSWRSFDSKTIAKLLLWWEEILIFFHFKMFSKKKSCNPSM